MSDLSPEQKHPVNIKVDIKKSEVRIEWADGYRSAYPLAYLRQICPCANCNQQRSNPDPLRVLTPEQMAISDKLTPERPVEMVGKYGLQFFWDDGHRSGIYSFEFLRDSTPS